MFFASFCHKRKRGLWGRRPHTPCEARRLRTKCGKKKKALRGGEGENKSFPPSNTTNLYKSYFKTVRWTVLKEQCCADLSLQHSKIVVQKQSTGLFLRKV